MTCESAGLSRAGVARVRRVPRSSGETLAGPALAMLLALTCVPGALAGPRLVVESVAAEAPEVRRGQSGLAVTMTVSNPGDEAASVTSAALSFGDSFWLERKGGAQQ